MHRLQVWLWANSARHWFSSFFSILLSLQLRKCPTSDHISLYLAILHVLSCVSFPSHQCSSLLSLYFLSFFLVVLQPFFDFSCSDSFRCVFLVLLFFDFFVSCCRHLRFLQQTWQVHEEEFAKLVDNLHRLLVLWCLAAFSALTNDAGVSRVLMCFEGIL